VSLVAVVYRTTDTGQEIAGRIRIRDGKLVAEPSRSAPLVGLVLGRPARKLDGTHVPPEPTEAFLRALPEAYTGIYLRVGLEEEEVP
jgi:hypothetical protein